MKHRLGRPGDHRGGPTTRAYFAAATHGTGKFEHAGLTNRAESTIVSRSVPLAYHHIQS